MKRRILLLSSLWPPQVLGGAETYAAELARRLSDTHEVGVLTLGVLGENVVGTIEPWPYSLDQYASQPLWKRALFIARDLWNTSAPAAISKAVEEFRPDIIHSHAIAGMSPAALVRASRIPLVHTIHDYWLLCRRSGLIDRSGKVCERRCASCVVVGASRRAMLTKRGPKIFISPSKAVVEEHVRRGWPTDRIRWIPHPVAAIGEAGRPAPRLSFGYMGQLTSIKGVSTLLKAFTQFDEPAARLHIAGAGPLETEVLQSSDKRVVHWGWVDKTKKENFFQSVDCLVVPSEWKDPAPLVVNEAVARGLAVIGAKIGGIPELVHPSSQPLLFESGNAKALLNALRRFSAMPTSHTFDQATSDNGGWSVHVERLITVYREAMEGGAAT